MQLIITEPGQRQPIRLAVYLGGDPTLLDELIGRRVRIEGKAVPVLQGQELWPARITALSAGDDRDRRRSRRDQLKAAPTPARGSGPGTAMAFHDSP